MKLAAVSIVIEHKTKVDGRLKEIGSVYLSKLSFSLEICGILGTSTANAIPTRAMK